MSENDQEKKKALVMGASGFLGSHLVKQLISQGHRVRILVRATSNLDALAGLIDQLEYDALFEVTPGHRWRLLVERPFEFTVSSGTARLELNRPGL